jgi:hypothetical protein
MSWSTWDSEESRRNKFFPVEILHDQEKYVVAIVADEADANLIAAAPDLLAACEAFRNADYRVDDLTIDSRNVYKTYIDAIDKARAAIAKAKGQD